MHSFKPSHETKELQLNSSYHPFPSIKAPYNLLSLSLSLSLSHLLLLSLLVFDNTVGGALLGRVLSEFYKSVEKLGFVAGGEFKAAVEEGKKR
jgi:hypothetical protein